MGREHKPFESGKNAAPGALDRHFRTNSRPLCPCADARSGARACVAGTIGAVSVDVERPCRALDHLLRDHHFFDPFEARQIEHGVEQNALHDPHACQEQRLSPAGRAKKITCLRGGYWAPLNVAFDGCRAHIFAWAQNSIQMTIPRGPTRTPEKIRRLSLGVIRRRTTHRAAVSINSSTFAQIAACLPAAQDR